MPDSTQPVRDLIARALADPGTGWSLGTFGAAGEFRRGPGERAVPLGDELGAAQLGLVSARGGIALAPRPDIVPVAYETPLPGGWSHALALCLPAAALPGPGRIVRTEIGPDRDALRPEASDETLFDLGLGLAQVAVCVRTRAPEVLARLRAEPEPLGAPLPADDRLADFRADLEDGRLGLVFAGPLGRVEVAAPGPSPGPRAYAAAAALRLRRSHAATAPIPPGLVPLVHIHPPHPLGDADGGPEPRHHTAFQALLARWGEPGLRAWKRHRLGLGPRPGRVPDRWTRAAERVAEIQARHGLLPAPDAEPVTKS